MSWFDLDLGDFNLGGGGGGGGWSFPGSFNLGMDWSTPSFNWGDTSGFNLGGGGGGGLNLGGGGGGGGFNWGDTLKNVGVGADILKTGVGTGLGIQSQIANAKYQKQLQDYYKTQQAQSAQYNAAVQDYLKQRAAWENQMSGEFGGVFGSLQEQMGQFQGTMQDIVNQEMAAAKPLLAQSQELLQPAVAALAKGEVPPMFAPILEQAKQRARAAAAQQYSNAGIDSGTAMASIEPQIDQQVQQMLIQAATAMLSGGQALSGQGLSFLGGAANAAQAGISPIMAEFQAMMQAISGLFGGFPGPTTGPAPPAPVA